MRHSIQLLGMSVKDLSEYIESILASNPCLKKLSEVRASRTKSSSFDAHDPDAPDEGVNLIEQSVDPYQGLVSQARMMDLDDKEMKIVEYLIYELDENGYMTSSLEDAAHNLSTSLEDVDHCLDILQSMDPPGIGAQDVRECLLIQLKRAGKEGSVEYRIVEDVLGEVAQNDTASIALKLGVAESAASKAVAAIKKLNPRPASTLLSVKSIEVTPELKATVDKQKVRIEINRGTLPQLKIYNPYENNLDIIKDPEAREFLKTNMDLARTLVDNLKRREDTVCKVADYILSFQKEYLLNRTDSLRCLTISDVAKEVGFHPSTISRAVSNKYVLVNGKTMALSSLLSHAVKKSDGAMASKSSIKTRIIQLVSAEDRSSPLSDDTIQKRLADEGIVLTRRTITKYRTALKILPTHLRKKKQTTNSW